jgi:glycosyltransferase involved in cell wall biosynthesis
MLRVLHVLPHRGGGGETYIDLLEGMADVAHRRAALSAGRRPADLARSAGRLYPDLVREARRADLVHVHGDAAAILALPLRPAVVTTHGLHLVRRAGGAAGAAVRAGVAAAVAVSKVTLCTSESELDDLRTMLPARLHPRLAVVANGIELPSPDAPRRAATRAALGLQDGQVAGLFLGELEARKDPMTAVRAASAAGERFVLLVAGAGPLEAEVRAQAGPAVRVLGYRADPGALLSAADVFVMPSRREGLSFAVLEAMGHALPIVVADGPGNPEAVGDAGLVVPAGDVAAFAATFAELGENASRRAELGRRARERVAAHFTAERLRDGVRAAYARAAGDGGQGA